VSLLLSLLVSQVVSYICAPRFGISFLGAPFAERTLIGFAYAFEQVNEARRRVKPYVSPRSEL